MLVVAALALLQLTPSALPGTRARIEGTVLRIGSNEPISGAKVTITAVNLATGANVQTAGALVGIGLNSPAPGGFPTASAQALPLPIPVVMTDRDGKFVVPELEEGTYRIAVSANGYVRQEYGQRVFPGQGTIVNLKRGEVLKDVVIPMTLTGNVNGKIYDNNGQPAVGAPVQLIKVAYNQDGRPIFQNIGTSRANDRGEYRIYWITPGRYYLAAGTTPADFANQRSSPNDSTDTYSLTFYPGTTDLNRATVVDIRSGDERVLDFSVGKQQLYKIRGRVLVDPATGQFPVSADITIAAAALGGGSTMRSYGRAYNPQNGILEVRDLMPGVYLASISSPAGSAKVPFEIVNNDIDGLMFILKHSVSILGRIQMDGGAGLPASISRVFLRVVPLQSAALSGFSLSAAPLADGSFTLENVLPGEYRVVGPDEAGLYLKSVLFGGKDVLNRTIQIRDTDSAPSRIEIILSPNVGRIDGIVLDDRSQPLPGIQAVLVPDLNRERTELFKTASTDRSGRFTLQGVTPGEYKAFAWEALEAYGYFDPELLRRSDTLGTSVRVDEFSSQEIQVRVIPSGR